jgi:acetylornithine/succinyldiaminopimelate/putrescine aminotransferase
VSFTNCFNGQTVGALAATCKEHYKVITCAAAAAAAAAAARRRLMLFVQATAPSEIVSFTNCFHGRTMGALALTYKEQYKTPFLPVMPGHVLAEYNNLDSAAKVCGTMSLSWVTVCF